MLMEIYLIKNIFGRGGRWRERAQRRLKRMKEMQNDAKAKWRRKDNCPKTQIRKTQPLFYKAGTNFDSWTVPLARHKFFSKS